MKDAAKRGVSGFIHTEGRRMVNEAGETVVLTGWGAGNWMNPEGFMVSGVGGVYGFTDIADKLQNNIRFDRARTITDSVRELCGTEYTKTFWSRWYRAYLSEGDIRAMAEMGYNSIRLVLDGSAFLYEEPGISWNEDSFDMLNQVLDDCEKWGLYAILDLHAAPGGQSGVSCDNGIDNMPHMFLEPESFERGIIIWEELARRYKDRYIVAGYELLNEPVSPPTLLYLRPQLRKFYEDAIERIRKIDTKHMIIIQPPAFAHDMKFLDKGFDPEYNNWCYCIHMYSFIGEMKDFYQYLEPSFRLNVPMWIGEGRSTEYAMAVLYEMMKEYDVGYNIWSWKSMDNETHDVNGLTYYEAPEGWDKIIKYITEGGPRPSYEESQKLMDAWIEGSKFENCKIRRDMMLYTLRKQGIELPAVGYDRTGGSGVSYYGTWRHGNPLAYRVEDQIKMTVKPGGRVPLIFDGPNAPLPEENLQVELSKDEFVSYTVYDITSPCKVSVDAYALCDAKVEVTCGDITTEVEIKAGECAENYPLLTLECGEKYKIVIKAVEGTVCLDKVKFPA